MRNGRFGNLTIWIWIGILILLYSLTLWLAQGKWLFLFVFFAVTVAFYWFVDPWLYPIAKKPVYSLDGKYVDIDLFGRGARLLHDGKVVTISVLNSPEPKLSVYDAHMWGWGKAVNGVNETLVETMAGNLTVNRTDKGFRVSWKDDVPWELI